MGNDDVWRYMSGEVFQLAEASLEMPIAAVGIDIEHFMGFPASYDDLAWARLRRRARLRRGHARCRAWELRRREGPHRRLFRVVLRVRWDAVIARWCEAIHAIRPGPVDRDHARAPHQPHHRTLLCAWRYRARAPAIIDNWGMYNGSGLTDDLLVQQVEVKALNPYNRFILWFRPDNYRPEDIRVHAPPHAAEDRWLHCNWHIGMLLPRADADGAKHEAAAARWQAYSEGNEAALARQSLRAARSRRSPSSRSCRWWRRWT